ncbi:putative alkaline ceramidase [Septoria linicola]|nr:putative alkaline ceramidase [Septoria linicola]
MDTNGKLWDQSSSTSLHGFWGTPTSNVNFCEEDYVWTYYVAEFFNTVTSLAYVAYGIHGIRRSKRHDIGIFSITNSSYFALIGVGVFSGLYHTTLKYHTQMSDELSMHVAIATVLLQVYTFQEPLAIQRRNAAIILGIIIPFVIYHCLTDEFILHVILFSGMSITVARRIRHIIRIRIKEKAQRAKLRSLVTFATASSLFAFFIWNVDNLFCPTLTKLKHKVGYPWAILLEGHGYWHVLTAMGAYTFMALVEFLTSPEGSPDLGFAWPAKATLRDLAGMVELNGHAKAS